MNFTRKYPWVLYLISITILLSILVQVYFNVKNYQLNKIEFIKQVRLSLDNASDNYFSEIAKQEKERFHDIFKKFDKLNVKSFNINKSKDSTNFLINTDVRNIKTTVSISTFFTPDNSDLKTDSIKITKGLETILISVLNKKIILKKLDSFFKTELNRKKIKLDYQINFYKDKKIKDSVFTNKLEEDLIKTYSKSTFLKDDEKLELLFKNNTTSILKNGFIGILLSLILSSTIILSLFYLLRTINKQKQIAEIKNDFISNITHEFKTPITTIGTAIEAIKEFNILQNKEKTDEYLNISKNQLQKLTVMVEKILETSALDSDKLLLKKEVKNVIPLVENIVLKASKTTYKSIEFTTSTANFTYSIDSFHFENAIRNLIDNAIKYGGNTIEITIKKSANNLQILIADNGSIPTNQRERIFDKFYRIPQGNTHNIKGFGIGLYYAKNIIEKHNGTLLLLKNKTTVFKIDLS